MARPIGKTFARRCRSWAAARTEHGAGTVLCRVGSADQCWGDHCGSVGFGCGSEWSPFLKQQVARMKPLVLAGQTPAEALATSAGFPETFVHLYATGEIHGKAG